MLREAVGAADHQLLPPGTGEKQGAKALGG